MQQVCQLTIFYLSATFFEKCANDFGKKCMLLIEMYVPVDHFGIILKTAVEDK